MRDTNQALCFVLIVLISFPIPFYPFLLIANVMSMASEPAANPIPIGLSLSADGFLWGSTLYPVPYTASMVGTVIWMIKSDFKTALFWLLLSATYLFIVGLLFAAWMILS